MLIPGDSTPNYKKQRPSKMALDVGNQLAQKASGGANGMAPDPMGGGMSPAPQMPMGEGESDLEHSQTSTRTAMAEALGRSLSVRTPSNRRYRPMNERQMLRQLGLPDVEIDMLQANDPANREGMTDA